MTAFLVVLVILTVLFAIFLLGALVAWWLAPTFITIILLLCSLAVLFGGTSIDEESGCIVTLLAAVLSLGSWVVYLACV